MIGKAIEFLDSRIWGPALIREGLAPEFKKKIVNSRNLVKNFRKVGDLYNYLNRFKKSHGQGNDELFNALREFDLETYEDVLKEFEHRFGDNLNEVTGLDDFKMGSTYTSYDIAFFAKSYTVQTGIYPIGQKPNYTAIFIKATLKGGKYPNQWIDEKTLKYYLYSKKGVFNENYIYNKAIIDSPKKKIPIYVFVRENGKYILNGIFRYIATEKEKNGAKWFKLEKIKLEDITTIPFEDYERDLGERIRRSYSLTNEERAARLEKAPKKPERIYTRATNYRRNPDVIAEVLHRAKGQCELCGNAAPFIRTSDLTPYLEVHHKKQLAQGGEDTVENAFALCPNCHRKEHYG